MKRPPMAIPLRRAVGWLGAASGVLAALAACSSPDVRPRSQEVEPPPVASLPPVEVPSDGGAGDATNKPPFDPTDEHVTCAATPCAVQLVAGDHHFCARMSDGTVRCWGDDARGALGGGEVGDAGPSTDAGDGDWRAGRVTDLADATHISAAGAATCAVAGDGGVSCWGANDKGQLGIEPAGPESAGEHHPTPLAVDLPSGAKRVDVGPTSACAVLTNGEVWCWGDNSRKQLARATAGAFGAPAKAELGALRVARTAAGTYSGFAVTDVGEILSWGAVDKKDGALAARVSSLLADPAPLAIELGPVSSFAISSTTIDGSDFRDVRWIGHACAIVSGDVYCWGDSLTGALAMGAPEPVLSPRRTSVASTTAWGQQVAVAPEITCVRLTDGTIECAGDNAFGALGRDPKTRYAIFFARAETFTGHAVHVAIATHTVCALLQGGSVVCWGSNERGELGQGTTDTDPHPTPVPVRL